MAEPRGRLFQGARFEVTELRGRTVRHLVGCTSRPGRDDRPEMMCLKPRDGHWQRFFLDAGIGFWEEWSEADAFADYAELRRVDYGARFGVVGARIAWARCDSVSPEGAARIALGLGTGVLQLRLVDAADADADCEIVFGDILGA